MSFAASVVALALNVLRGIEDFLTSRAFASRPDLSFSTIASVTVTGSATLYSIRPLSGPASDRLENEKIAIKKRPILIEFCITEPPPPEHYIYHNIAELPRCLAVVPLKPMEFG